MECRRLREVGAKTLYNALNTVPNEVTEYREIVLKIPQKLQLGSVTILSNHPVLDQVARDIFQGLKSNDLPNRKVTVYVGLHRKFRLYSLRPGLRVCIQTEHFLDGHGQKMWKRESRSKILLKILFYHRILDLSYHNRPYYDFLPKFLRKRVSFGPYIFPGEKPKFRFGTDEKFVFYGEINDRRKKLIASEPSKKIKVLSSPTFGKNLSEAVSNAAGILNLHYVDGYYSEIPRLLSACLLGKVIMSEPLSDELVPNRDYLLLGDYPSEERAGRVFDSFWENFATRHKFQTFLKSISDEFEVR